MAGKNKVVLLVEDDEMLHTMYKAKFERDGFMVLDAFNGKEALTVVEQKMPDIVLLDIIMPKMDGFVALTKMKKIEKVKEIPVVLLTNLGQEDDIRKGKDLGAADYFIKANHTPQEIVDKVKAILAM